MTTPSAPLSSPADRRRGTGWVGGAAAVLARELVTALRPGASPGAVPLRGRPARLLPYLVALYGVVVATAAGAALNERGGVIGGIWFLMLLPAAGGLALAAARPLDGWRLVTGWLLVIPFLLPPPPGVVPALEPWAWCLWIPALLLAAWAAPGRRTLAIGLLSAVVLGLLTVATPWPVHTGYLPVSVLGIAVPLVVGASLGGHASARRALAEEQRRLAAAQAERGALAERARIAREMHDVIGHHMSLIAVRCETGPYRLGDLPEPAARELGDIAAAAREALTEMQELLGVLRSDDGRSRTPQPGMADLDRLLTDAAAAGTPLTWSVVPAASAVPAPLALTAYRIVQQALANATQHAPGGAVAVRVRRRDEPDGVAIVIEVDNDAGTAAGRPGAGTGLRGMRERAAVHGGTVTAAPRPDGGFTLRAVLPLREGRRRRDAPREGTTG